MQCYYCEEPLKEPWFHFDSGAAICEECLWHIGVYELLELLKIPSFADFLTRYGIAVRHTAPGF